MGSSYPGFINGSAPSQSADRDERAHREFLRREGRHTGHAAQNRALSDARSAGVDHRGIVRRRAGRCRRPGGIWTGTRAFVVIGSGYYEVFTDATITRRGTVAIDGNPAQFAYNGTDGGTGRGVQRLAISTCIRWRPMRSRSS
jgi:hypothetical protein